MVHCSSSSVAQTCFKSGIAIALLSLRTSQREIFKNIGNNDLFPSWLPANWLRHISALCVKPIVALLLIPGEDFELVTVLNYMYFTSADIPVCSLACTLSCSSSGNVACTSLMCPHSMIPFSPQPGMTSWPQWSADWPVRARWVLVTAQVVIRQVTVVIARSTFRSPTSELMVVLRLYVVVVVPAVTTALIAFLLVTTCLLLVKQAFEGQTICKRGREDQQIKYLRK